MRLCATRAEHALFLRTVRELPDNAWQAPSRAAGWTVQDVVAHQSAGFSGMFGRVGLRALRTDDIERANEVAVARRRSWPPGRVLAEYETWQPRALRAVAVATLPGPARARVRVGELGWFPLALLPSAMVFDSATHLRHDLGPVLDIELPDLSAEGALVAGEWMLAVAANLGRLTLRFLAGRTVGLDIRIAPGLVDAWTLAHDGRRVHAHRGRPVRADATISTPGSALLSWASGRSHWQDHDLVLHGDRLLATAVADALHVI